MKIKHTPGPWERNTGPKSLDADHRYIEIHSVTGGKTGDGNVIATVHGDIFNHTVPFMEEAKYNAILIEHAPELLESAIAVVGHFSYTGRIPEELAKALNQLTTAIAKATSIK